MSTTAFLDKAITKMQELRDRERQNIASASRAIADAVANDGLLYAFGCGHSAALVMDVFYRAGGLLLVNPIFDERILLNWRPVTETTEWEHKEGWADKLFAQSGAKAGDAIMVFSNSGRNCAPIDVALSAKAAGLTVIAVTSITAASALPSPHSTGKRLHEAADIILDNHVDPGDASISLPGLAQRIGPLSTILGSALAQAVIVETINNLLERGIEPPVYISSNVAGGSEHNEKMFSRFRDRLDFL